MAEAANAAIDVAAACHRAAADIAAAWARAFGIAVTLTPGTAAALPVPLPPAKLATSGLLIKLVGPSQQCWVAVAGSEAVMAAWSDQPDDATQSKLDALAAELAPLLLGPGHAHQAQAQVVGNLLEALVEQLRVCPRLMAMPCSLSPVGGTASIEAFITWTMPPDPNAPAEQAPPASEMATASNPSPQAATAATGAGGPARADVAGTTPTAATKSAGLHAVEGRPAQPSVAATSPGARAPSLPAYSRSLLKISVPVSVTLARKKQRASQILELGPGAIIQFDRSCEEALDLEVGGHRIAMGEAVKVGDKFGLRIIEMVRTEERFVPVRRENPAAQAGSSKRLPVSRS